MAKYNLNEVLKAREAAGNVSSEDSEVKLDDVTRVKVLSPGRKVFKRFIRNRLAVFGSVLLIIMFLFSFAGPLFYAYGQKQIFYKYDEQNVNYALAKVNTAYNGYTVDASVTPANTVLNAMNSNIKQMLAAGEEQRYVFNDAGVYSIDRIDDNIFTLSEAKLKDICSYGSNKITVGTFNSIDGSLDYSIDEIPGLAAAAKKNVAGKSGTFKYGGVEYSYEKSVAKSYTITCVEEGIQYTGEALGEEFEAALAEAAEKGTSFDYDGHSYILRKNGSLYEVYEPGDTNILKIYTLLTIDTFETGAHVSDSFRAAALMSVSGNGNFTCDGISYSIKPDPASDGFIIYNADGSEFAEYSGFTVRRYSGEDSMDYSLKKTVQACIEEMLEADRKESSVMAVLPQQTAEGTYEYNEDGTLKYTDTELKITQRLEGEYVINCKQIIYIINRFEDPSPAHILGTDGDGFDVLARIMYGGRVSLMVGFVVVFLETFLGIIMGGLAGYYGGWVDNLIMRLVDIFYCLPSLPIMIILGAMMDAMRMDTYIRLLIMMAALGIMGWAGVARLVRGQILSLREQEFMVAAEATGIKVKARIFRHLVPNVMPQLIVTATMGMGGVIITESTLSFLGLGVKHPLATWGTIINSVSSASSMAHYAYIWIPVGLLICLTVIAFNFVGDGLRDAYDPKAKR